MKNPDAITSGNYLDLRVAARQALADLGIPSNPGFSDHNIVTSFRVQKGLEPIEPWDESDIDAQDRLVDELGIILNIEPPSTVGGITLKLVELRP